MRPNLLIVMVDQMQAQLLDPDSPAALPLPNLEALRARSTRFTHAFCPAPICTPTRASFQLSCGVDRHGVIGNDRPMPADIPTLPERLRAVGYATGYVGKWHLDPDNPRGWQTLDDAYPKPGFDPGFDFGKHVMAGIDAPHQGVAPYGDDDHLDGRVLHRGLSLLERLGSGSTPWAAMVSFYGPHAPYYVPRKWYDLFDPDEIDLPADFDEPFANKPDVERTFRCRAWGQTWSEQKWRAIRAAYFGYCAMLDDLIGRLLADVDDDTAVLFLSDHGEMNGHHRMIYKGPMMYEQLVRVPALLRLPGGGVARVDDRLVQTQDFTATLLGLARCDAAERVHPGDGIDLLDLGAPKRTHVVSEFYEANWVTPPVHQRVGMCRSRDWKYVLTEGQGEALYDMRAPVVEVENRIASAPPEADLPGLRAGLAGSVSWAAGVAESGNKS